MQDATQGVQPGAGTLAPTQPEATPAPVAQPAGEGQQQPTAGSPETEQKPVKTFTQEDVDKIVARRLAKEQRKNSAQSTAELRQQLKAEVIAELQQAQQQPQSRGEPKPDDYPSYEAYLEARAEWRAVETIRRRDREAAEEWQRRQEMANAQNFSQSFKQKYEAAIEKYDEFEDIAPATPFSPAVMVAVNAAENAPDVLYYLAKNPKEAANIAAMQNPYAVAVAIGRIEAKLSAPPAAQPQPSKAPPPIQPIAGKGDPDAAPKNDFESFLKRRNKELGRA
jgi:hypothetical protein